MDKISVFRINRKISVSASIENMGISGNEGQKRVRCDMSKGGVSIYFRFNIQHEGQMRAAGDGSNEDGLTRASCM